MSKRMFEHAAEGKFWEVWIDGANVFTRHGKLGSSGQTKLKPGDQAVMDKMIKDKLVEGYAQTGGEVAKGPELDKKTLKRHLDGLKPLADDPAYLVLADWLQTQNHPWGELIVLQHGAATNPKKAASLGKQAAKHLKENGPLILGPAASDPSSHFEWHHGFVRRAVIGTPADDSKVLAKNVKAFLDSPVAHMIETLVIAPYRATFPTRRDWGRSDEDLVDPWTDLDKIAKLIPSGISRVGLGGWPATLAQGYVMMPAFSKVSSTFPKLTALELTGCASSKPGKLSLSHCTDLAVRFSRGTADALRALATSKLPKLSRLSVWLGGTEFGIVDECHPAAEWDEDDEDAERYPSTFTASDLEEMGVNGPDSDVRPEDLKVLLDANFGITHLELGSPSWSADLMTTVTKGKLIKGLKTLTIAGGWLSADTVKPLIDAKKALAHLESIEVTGQIDAETVKKLGKVPNIKAVPVEEPANFHLRYAAAME